MEDRMTGRSTRLADEYVQKLFENYQDPDNKMLYVTVVDHFPERNSNLFLVSTIQRRISIEHGLECDVMGNRMRIKPN